VGDWRATQACAREGSVEEAALMVPQARKTPVVFDSRHKIGDCNDPKYRPSKKARSNVDRGGPSRDTMMMLEVFKERWWLEDEREREHRIEAMNLARELEERRMRHEADLMRMMLRQENSQHSAIDSD